MSDLNLIPQEFKFEKEKKKKKAFYVVISVLAVAILVFGAFIPSYFILMKTRENLKVQQQIESLSYVTQEVDKLNAQKAALQDRLTILDTLTKQDIKWNKILSDISALTPAGVSLTGLNITKDGIAMQCTAQSQQVIAVFIANIENSPEFTFSKVNTITPDQKGGTFKFDISFSINNVESQVK